MPKLHRFLAAGLTLALLACADRSADHETTDTTDTTTSSTSDPASTGTTQPTSTSTTDILPSSTSTTSDTTFAFALKPDLFPPTPCDLYAQSCPNGEKCTVGVQWSTTHCVPVTGDQEPGEPCKIEGDGGDGHDDCERGATCWDTDPMGMGICTAFCTGSLDTPVCPDHFMCEIGRVFDLCIPNCDPLIQDCPGNDLCLSVGETFICVDDNSGDAGQQNDPCAAINTCDKGLVCLTPAQASADCDQGAQGCCQPFCEFVEGQPGDCPNPDQKCLQWYDPRMPIPAGDEDVGVCAIPF